MSTALEEREPDLDSSSVAETVPPQVDPEGRVRPPRAVWLVVLLLGFVSALWTVAVPAYRAPDEHAHLDLVLYLADGHGYPSFDGRYFGEEIGFDTERHLIDSREPWPVFDADDAPPRSDRPDVDDLGGLKPETGAWKSDDRRRADWPYVYNQMPQHPPLYYLSMAGLLQVERSLLPGDGLPGLDRELGLLRLANILLLLPLPLLAWATVKRIGGGDRAGVVAALLPLGLPQMTHIGASLNNDNLLVLLGAFLSWMLAGVARGERTRRTDVGVGVVLALALLTKAFALMFVPWIATAYLLGMLTTRRLRTSALSVSIALGVGAILGGWWWVGNWIREGQPAPTTESLTRTTDTQPEGFNPEIVEFTWTFLGRLTSHTWAWIGYRSPKFELPPGLVIVLTLSTLAAGAIALAGGSRGLAVMSGRYRRADVLFAWLPVVLLAVFVHRRAWGLYQTTGLYSFIQGRYLFGAIVGTMAVAAVGITRVLGRRAIGATLGLVALLQVWVLSDVVEGSWSGPGLFGPVRGALAWSPWPGTLVLAVAAAAAATTGWIALEARRL